MLEEKNGSNGNKNRKTKVTATEFSLRRKRFGQHSSPSAAEGVTNFPNIRESFLIHIGSGKGRNRCRPRQTGPTGHVCTETAAVPGLFLPLPRLLETRDTTALARLPAGHSSEPSIPFTCPADAATPRGRIMGGRGELFPPAGSGAAPRLLRPVPFL